MVEAAPWTSYAIVALGRDQFTPTRVRKHKGRVWFVWAAPPGYIQEGFGLAPELLVVLVDGEVKARDLHAASEEVFHSELRLDDNLMIVCDRFSSPLQPRLTRIGGRGQRIAWVPDARGEWPSLREVLQQTLPTFDAFEERDAVRGAQLVGREAEVAQLSTRVARGEAVGLFGLRKMGKTSVLRAVTDRFDPASGMMNDEVDLQTCSNIAVVLDAGVLVERTVDALGEELLQALARRMRAAKEEMPDRRGHGLAAWKSVVEVLLDEGRPVCVAIDEYDLLFEGEGGEGAIPKLNQFFRLMRGWSQMHQGRASLVLVGRDSTFLSAPEIDGVTNALLMWCAPMWLGPLSLDKGTELLRKIGHRVGLSVGAESARVAREWTGGHPLLQRQFGSELRAAVRAKNPAWGAATDEFVNPSVDRYKGREAVLEVPREVVALLRKRHAEAYGLLRDLAEGYSWDDALTGYGGPEGEAARTLANFGLVHADHSIARTFGWYLNTLVPTTPLLRKTA